MTARCTGHCCREIWIAHDPADLLMGDHLEDGGFLCDALVPERRSPDGDGYVYSCRHLTQGGDCGAYDDRPPMCRGYPYERPCLREGCTLTNRGLDPYSHHVFYFYWHEREIERVQAWWFTW